MRLPQRVTLCEVGTRDGFQIEPQFIPTEQKIEVVNLLAAAGVLDTPALLLRSGLATRGVGGGLALHSTLYVAARFAEPVHGYYGPTMAWGVTEFADVLGMRGPGFMLENTAVHPVATALALPGFGIEHERAIAALPHLARCVVLLRDRTLTPGRFAEVAIVEAEGYELVGE